MEGTRCSLHRKKLTNLIIWEMHGFSHQFPIARKNATKPTVWGGPGKLVLILFPQYGCSFPIGFPSYGSFHYIGNVQVFLSISNSIGKISKNHQIGKAWEISSHTFSIVWVLFSIRFPSCGKLHRMRNALVSPINFPQHGKM